MSTIIVLMTICFVLTEATDNGNSGQGGLSWKLDAKPGAGLNSTDRFHAWSATENGNSGQAGLSWMPDAKPGAGLNSTDRFHAWSADVAGIDLEPRILGGSAASIGQFPWQVAIISDNFVFCGGSIISSQWVLTAGSCVVNATASNIAFGSLALFGYDDPEGVVTMTARSYVLHDHYKNYLDESKPSQPRHVLENDIALIKLVYPLSTSTNTIAPVKLPTRAQQTLLLIGEDVIASGWGFKTYPPRGYADTLQFVDLRVIANKKCDTEFVSSVTIQSSNMCTASKTAKFTFTGDMGGALVWKDSNGTYRQVGIVSFGVEAGYPANFPSGFTRVTSYLDWISNITGIAIAHH